MARWGAIRVTHNSNPIKSHVVLLMKHLAPLGLSSLTGVEIWANMVAKKTLRRWNDLGGFEHTMSSAIELLEEYNTGFNVVSTRYWYRAYRSRSWSVP